MGAFSPEPPSKNPLRQPKLYKTKHSDVDIKSDESIEFELGVDRPRKVIYVVAGLALLFFALFRGASAYAVEARQLRGAPSLKAETPKSYLDKQLAPEGSCDAKIWCGAEPFTKPASLCGAAPFLTAANAPALFDSCKTHRCDFSADSCTTYSEFFCYNKINVVKGSWREVCSNARVAISAFHEAATHAYFNKEAEELTKNANRLTELSDEHCYMDEDEMDERLSKVLEAEKEKSKRFESR